MIELIDRGNFFDFNDSVECNARKIKGYMAECADAISYGLDLRSSMFIVPAGRNAVSIAYHPATFHGWPRRASARQSEKHLPPGWALRSRYLSCRSVSLSPQCSLFLVSGQQRQAPHRRRGSHAIVLHMYRLQPSESGPIVLRFSRRHAPGLTPTTLLKTLVRWLWSAKPQSSAISQIDRVLSQRNSLATSTLRRTSQRWVRPRPTGGTPTKVRR